MQNSTFFVLLRLIFAAKLKIAPAPSGFGSRSCERVAVIWTRIVKFLGPGAHPKLVKTFYFFIYYLFYFFGDHLISAIKTLRICDFGRKNLSNFGEDLFFSWRSLRKPPQSHLKLIKIWVKFVYGCIKLLKRPRPLRNPGYAPAYSHVEIILKERDALLTPKLVLVVFV